MFIISIIFYFLPTLIAFIRGHDSKIGIMFLNALLGWTLIFWVLALVWSVSGKGGKK